MNSWQQIPSRHEAETLSQQKKETWLLAHRSPERGPPASTHADGMRDVLEEDSETDIEDECDGHGTCFHGGGGEQPPMRPWT